jgi:hypothetical protein
VRIEATYAAGRALLHLGHPDEARRTARAGYADHLAFEGEIGTGHPAIHLITYAQALLAAGRLAEAERVADSLMVGSREARSNVGETWAGLVLGDAAMLAGRLDDAVTRLDTVANLARRCGQRAHLVLALASSVVALVLLHEEAGARRAMGELVDEPVVTKHEVAVERAQAWAEAAAGDLGAAQGRLLAAARRAEVAGQGSAEATLRHDLVRFGAPGTRPPDSRSWPSTAAASSSCRRRTPPPRQATTRRPWRPRRTGSRSSGRRSSPTSAGTAAASR